MHVSCSAIPPSIHLCSRTKSSWDQVIAPGGVLAVTLVGGERDRQKLEAELRSWAPSRRVWAVGECRYARAKKARSKTDAKTPQTKSVVTLLYVVDVDTCPECPQDCTPRQELLTLP